jgi:hypothetical protein
MAIAGELFALCERFKPVDVSKAVTANSHADVALNRLFRYNP